MKISANARLAISGTFALGLALGFSNIALGEETSTPGNPISDGSALTIKDYNIKITPPLGWEMITDASNLSLILQEPKAAPVAGDYVNPTYQRNLTVAVIHEASPIDAQRADALEAQLNGSFGKNALISDFKVTERKFFDYRGKNDGILMYATMSIGGFAMTQMHVLVSGTEKQVLMTYTDLASEFSKTGGGFDKAWSTISSIDVPGVAPNRYLNKIIYGSSGASLFALLALALFIRRRRELNSYMTFSDEIYKDDHGLTNASMISSVESVAAEALTDNIDVGSEDKANSMVSNF
jgi:hypothetical protein